MPNGICQMSDVRCGCQMKMSNVKCQMPNVKCLMSNFKFQMSNVKVKSKKPKTKRQKTNDKCKMTMSTSGQISRSCEISEDLVRSQLQLIIITVYRLG